MASLRHSALKEADPRIGFSLEVLGYENGKGLTYETQEGKHDFEFNFDWYECRLGIELHGKRFEHSKTNSMDYEELPYFVKWLREIMTKERAAFETTEPFFHINVERVSGGPMFRVTLLLSAYGIVPGYFEVDSGLAVKFSVRGAQFAEFADELEKELKNLQARYSDELELWGQYKDAEMVRLRNEVTGEKPMKKN